MINTTQELIEDIKNGKMVILMDDEGRENEGDIIVAAEKITPEIINFLATNAKGLICLPLSEEICNNLNLPMMTYQNQAGFGTNFTVSIEAKVGVSTGISAKDRATTVLAAVKDGANQNDIAIPGHIFPLKANNLGVLGRDGHTEASCDLASLAGLKRAAVICEIIKENGEMARKDDLLLFAKQFDLKIGTIENLIKYRIANENILSLIESKQINSFCGEFSLSKYKSNLDGRLFLSLHKGQIINDFIVHKAKVEDLLLLQENELTSKLASLEKNKQALIIVIDDLQDDNLNLIEEEITRKIAKELFNV